MTILEGKGQSPIAPHVAELRLRRFRLGELEGSSHEEVARHTTECAQCRARLRLIEEEQRQFERDIPFDRFAGGVERARRVDLAPRRRPFLLRHLVAVGAVGFAAAAALVLVARPLSREGASTDEPRPFAGQPANRLKGAGATASLRIAHVDGVQESAPPGSLVALRRGDRIRLGFRMDSARHVLALALDESGAVTPLHPAQGPATPLQAQRQMMYLPDSFELTGTGHERLFLILSDRPLSSTSAAEAARAAFAAAGGKLTAMQKIPLDGGEPVEQFTWLLHKP